MTKLPITVVATTSETQLLNPEPGRRMELPGFDDEFVDFPDYIVRITDRIWHQRKIELCQDYYTPDCAIHTLAGDIVGANTVMANTHATLASFPDRRLEADNVIWSDDGEEGFYSSHLITSPMTNLGETEFGPATGKKIRVITIADCACSDNRIYEEWLVRDYAAMAMQLGHDPQEIAKTQAQDDLNNGRSLIDKHAELHAKVMAEPKPDAPRPTQAENEPEAFALHMLKDIWGSGDKHAYAQNYDFRTRAIYPGLRDMYGHGEILELHREVFEAISDAKICVDHIADIPYLGDARDVAVRWTLAGHHSADGHYGKATGAPVIIIGVTHWRIINGLIHKEVTIWDDVAVRRQIETVRLAG